MAHAYQATLQHGLIDATDTFWPDQNGSGIGQPPQ